MSDSFHDLLVASLPRLRVSARYMTRNAAAADDLVQEAVAKALAARDSFEAGSNFNAWISRILYNTFISGMRRRREAAASDHELAMENFAVAPSADNRLILQELNRCMARLPAEQVESLLMIVLDGLSYEEVAERTGVAVGTAKCRVFRARRALQHMLLGEEVGTAARQVTRGAAVSKKSAPSRMSRPMAPHT